MRKGQVNPKTSKYFGVSYSPKKVGCKSEIGINCKKPYSVMLYDDGNKLILRKMFKTEKEAAMAVDVKLIQLGKEPVNILRRK